MIYNLAHNGNKLITFTIDGATYQAEEGMTWGEWFDSKYNTGLITYTTCKRCGESLKFNKNGSKGFGYYGNSSMYYYVANIGLKVKGAAEGYTTTNILSDVILADNVVISIHEECWD